MTCVPAFAPATSDGSTSDGIVASRTGLLGDPAVLRRVERALHVVDRRRPDLDAAAQQPRVAAGGRELGQRRRGRG